MPRSPDAKTGYVWNGRIVLIGASTGGVEALETVLSGLPENCAPVAVVQHMPPVFLKSFARRLDRKVRPRVVLAAPSSELRQGQVLLAPGDPTHLTLDPHAPMQCRLVESARVSGHRPSVDMLFRSATAIGQDCVAVVLTGMGRDGAEGLLALHRAGAVTLVQDRDSSVVYGMPRAARELGGAGRELPLARIASTLVAETSRTRRAHR